ncbi:restriction endonuclease subunit S [Mitsuokella jalaludinii]|uniref:restriction endonuclease subunit S n=1 Tax=Mitsuokella jalaludinii TaxID=187979 RepID=UPI00068EAACA|nr:restriction endonuclease subunit S [Mitsuokella jalaludinii]MCQ1534033.1 restriction endonuclease subunit S [Mitsuokella jalaludinii]
MNAQDLKSSILQRAIEGKLVPQLKEEGTAKELLAEIRSEKARLIKEKKIKKSKPLPEITDAEKPFDIPDSWEWVRLKDLGQFSSGKTPSKQVPSNWENGIVNWFTSKDIKSDYLSKSQILISEEAAKGLQLYPVGTLLMVVRSGILKRLFPVSLLKAPGTINQDIKAFQIYDERLSMYLFLCLKGLSPYILKQFRKQVTTVDSLRFEDFSIMPIPMPPLAESQRILDRVAELQPDIDAYDKAQTKLRTIEQRFPDAMKKSLLQYAIEGKLVPQRKEEGTAKDLLVKIRAEKAQLIKEKKIKKTKPLPAITDDEKPFDIPDSWEWARFGDISINMDSERIPLSVTQRRKLDKIYDYYGASGIIDKVDQYLFDRPLMLIGEDGANLLARTKPIAFIARGKYWVNNHAHVIDFPNGIDMKYMTFYMNAINLAAYVTGTAQPKMNQARMNSILIAIPPLAEQHRIVAKLEELLPLCQHLTANP